MALSQTYCQRPFTQQRQHQQRRCLPSVLNLLHASISPCSTSLHTQHKPAHTSQKPAALCLNRLQRRVNAAAANGASAPSNIVPDASVSVILLAGGVGKRMGAAIPKQYLDLRGQPIATYSLQMFARMREVCEIVIVCDPSWREVFQRVIPSLPQTVKYSWALPGAERQDSVFNGLQQVRPDSELVAVHDSARPLVTPADAARCFVDGWQVGAAVLGVAVKPTIKEVDPATGLVVKTLQRAKLWEVQTPQVIRTALLREGFELVRSRSLEVTDDVSIIEALDKPVRVTPGSYTNIKVTTPDDMSIAEKFLDEQQQPQQQQQQQQQQKHQPVVAATATAAA